MPILQRAVRGYLMGTFSTGYDVPYYCYQCGKPYPWTERKKAAAMELFAEVLDMENDQKEELKRDLDAISVDEPRTEVATLKIKRLIGKAGKEAAGMLREAVINIGSEVAVKLLKGG